MSEMASTLRFGLWSLARFSAGDGAGGGDGPGDSGPGDSGPGDCGGQAPAASAMLTELTV